jgi:protein SFI1
MRAVFWQWQAALQERKAALDNLRRCLIRKRVAFKLFRNWYWESFDDEVQVIVSLQPNRG